jgi:hypothetical protein
MSNHPQWGAYDRGSCPEEPCEIERLMHGSESEVGTERFLPIVTYTLDEKSLAESWGECQGETLTSLIIAF